MPDLIAGPTLPESTPQWLRIRRLGVATKLALLGLLRDGTMEVPADPAAAGWYTKGPSPGALGPAVIAGHVTWGREPGVFFRLPDLRPGDRVEVGRADGTVAVFSIRRTATFQKTRFPTEAVFGPTNSAELRLITCGGAYDDTANRYGANVVVFAELVGVRRP